jgi:RNA recognition motif-containing protein
MAENGGGDDGMMRIGKRCYVSNLAWKTSWQDLKDKFRDCGNVVYANVTRGEDGRAAAATIGLVFSAV